MRKIFNIVTGGARVHLISKAIPNGSANCEKKQMIAFDEVFETFYKRVYNYIWYRVNHKEIAEDLTSLVFEKAMIRMDQFDPEKGMMEVWMISIARNIVTDYFRSVKRRPQPVALEYTMELISNDRNDEQRLIDREEKAMLARALQSLHDNERNLLAMKYAAQLTNVSIAQILNISESNVGVKIHRCLKKLKKELLKGGYHEKNI